MEKRVIKFMAWDILNKEMRVVSEIKFDAVLGDSILYEVETVVGERVVSIGVQRYDLGTGITKRLQKLKDGEFKLLEFTGRLDKNNVEIYESYWCRACFRDNEGFHYVQGTIFMDEYMWCLKAEGSVCNGDVYSINRLHDFEIIGNIYQNPELLSQTTNKK